MDVEGLVHFSGRWTEEQKQRVAAVIEAVERGQEDVPLPPGWKRWVCVATETRQGTIYTATRVGESTVASAPSFPAFLGQIARLVR
ncbi:MAG: hypothetical protein KatS3mg042_1271 [Rhodothermaceae bacterium]|nr:MAG: hypothetical protein KatS3mg042_1271 [Rhodothermaceae bacterium]